MKKILMITTGGTIASQMSESGLKPKSSGDEILSYIPKIKELCDIVIEPLMQIDSSNMTPALMAKIAQKVYKNYDDYDGFVITHGTDTMAYSASLLNYMLKNLSKPVIFTGSQISISEENSDAPQNLQDAFIAAISDISGVFIAFGGRLMLGQNAVKTKTHSFDGFESINQDYIAHFKDRHMTYTCFGQKFTHLEYKSPFTLMDRFSDKVAILKISPAMPKQVIENAAQYCDALIVEAFGVGGIPCQEPNLQQIIIEAQKQNTLIVIASQCLHEAVDLSVYEVGVKILKENILSAKEMTTENIWAKLIWALGHSKNLADAQKLFLA
ncbi:MAG: asparaginase [Alphaproteobacteria bacterium]